MEKNIYRSHSRVTQEDREKLLRQKGSVIWLTGLSGSGKSTIAKELELKLHKIGKTAYILDGDNIRHGLNSDLGFSDNDRTENIRRIAEVAALFTDAGIIAITAFISPFRKDRENARRIFPEGRFMEIYVNSPIEICESRDPKGLYKKARVGKISDFTGIASAYEAPENPELELKSDQLTIEESADAIITLIKAKQIIR